MSKLTHFADDGSAHMVDVGGKPETERVAVASGRILMRPDTLDRIRSGAAAKGDVLGVARLAGILAAKKTGELIPLCHPIPLTSIAIDFDGESESMLVTATVKTVGRTGVEMEALTAVSVACLTVYDMVKSVDREVVIERIRLESKSGGRFGDWSRTN
jgi:cyclic pyranopterin phosphate synthase